jgi:hypothetical protein
MRAFVIKTLIFFLPLLLIEAALEILLRLIPNVYTLKKEYLDKHADDIEILVLGSSHSFFDINPEYFSLNCFNAGNVTQTLNYDLEILKKYDNKWGRLKTVILPVSYFSLYEKLESGSESWRIKNYTIYFDLHNSVDLKYHSEILSNKLLINLKRIVSYYIQRNDPVASTSLGWGISYNSKKAQDLNSTGLSAAKRHTTINSGLFSENAATLESIVAFCRIRDIDVILFTPPAYGTYRDNLEKDQLTRTLNKAAEIAGNNDNCLYFNMLSDTTYKAADFYDADHLNETGARRLSLTLNRIITWEADSLTAIKLH